jgi:hypothetical protein
VKNEIIFSAQHNGKGKNHLIADDDGDELCGSKGVFLFTSSATIILKDGIFYEEFFNHRTVMPNALLELEYCKKCIKKAKTLQK